VPQLQVLRAARGAEPVEPTSVLLPTVYGQVKVDVLEVRQIEIDQPSDDPGDRLHAFAPAWASDSATEVTIEVAPLSGAHVEVSALVAEPGPLVAMKLQAIMNRVAAKQGTDLQDIAGSSSTSKYDPLHWLNSAAATRRLPQTSHSGLTIEPW
jgi:hypothetical protein